MLMRIAVSCTLAALLAGAGCTSTAPSTQGLVAGRQVVFEGRLDAIDTSPWTYDGNARLVVDTVAHGDVVVELPARWNLCKAAGIGDAGAFAVGERVQVAGTVSPDRTVVVCEHAQHRIERLP